jgi:hypothetical protein
VSVAGICAEGYKQKEDKYDPIKCGEVRQSGKENQSLQEIPSGFLALQFQYLSPMDHPVAFILAFLTTPIHLTPRKSSKSSNGCVYGDSDNN